VLETLYYIEGQHVLLGKTMKAEAHRAEMAPEKEQPAKPEAGAAQTDVPGADARGQEIAGLSVRIKASDAETGRPIQSLAVLPAFHSERIGQNTWQSQYLKRYQGDTAEVRIDRPWEQTVLRIEAEGYVRSAPGRSGEKKWQWRSMSLWHRTPALLGPCSCPTASRPPGVAGDMHVDQRGDRRRRQTPLHRPRPAAWEAGHVGGRRLVPPPERGRPLGARGRPRRRLRRGHGREFAKSSTVRLKPWGRIEGELAISGKPVGGQEIGVGLVGRSDVMLHFSDRATTDAAGRFVVEHVAPVTLIVAPLFRQGDSTWNLLGSSGRMSIAAGRTTRITLPRPGRPVVGRVSLPRDSGLSPADVAIDISISLRHRA